MASSIKEVHEALVKATKEVSDADLSAGGPANEADTFDVVLNAVGRADLAALMRALLTSKQDAPTNLGPAELADVITKFKAEVVNYI